MSARPDDGTAPAASGAPDDERFNVSAAAIRHPQLTLFFLLVIAIAGSLSFFKLGQREDPDFTFRGMVIRTLWPGATTEQVDRQITDRIEKKLQETPYFKWTRSYSKPGESLIVLELLDTAPRKEVPQIWYQVRKKVGDIRSSLPAEAIGPFFNDEFGDVFGTIYAFTGDGFSLAELRDAVESVRQELLRLPDVAKVELVGQQDEKVFVELSPQLLANLGIDPQRIAEQLAAQNIVTPAGSIQGESRQVPLRVTGQFDTVREVEELRLNIGGRTVRLGDGAKVWRGYADPPAWTMRFGGKQAVGLAVSMVPTGDVLELGENLERTMARLKADMPIGIEFAKVSDQPKLVKKAVGLFLTSLIEAVAIVLAVSFLSLGMRAGGVVALTIPLVLAGTFLAMAWFGIDLHRISTGALIIALGLLVDDAMIVVEMMARKVEEGWDKFRAATFAYRSTAFPMLTGTLITAAGFLPIATAKSTTGEYTFAIFAVVTIALLVSWVAAIAATPFIGFYLLKSRPTGAHHEVFDTRFYRTLRAVIEACMRWRWVTIAATAALFGLGIVGMKATEKQFFPSSDRAEILVELWLPEGASYRATEDQARRFEAILAKDPDVSTFVGYVGNGSPRYYLSLDQQLFRPNFAQFVVLTKDVDGRDRALPRLRKALDDEFPGIRSRAFRTPLGPPVAYPVQFRVLGPEPQALKAIGEKVAEVIRADPHTLDVHPDWGERAPAIRIDVDQDKARAIGLSSAQVARAVGGAVSGATIGTFRERDKLIEVVLRAPEAERASLANVGNLQIQTALGRSVPLSQIATVREVMEEPILWRRSREPNLTVRADIVDGVQAPDVTMAIDPKLAQIRASLPPGYRIEAGGPYEENLKAQASINAGMPLMLALVVALLMIQLQRFSLAFMVLVTAPLGVVGVAAALLASGRPFGFVAMLGTIALGGMIMRNTVILVDQIRQYRDEGHGAWEAVRESAVRRFRPILLTAAAAIFAMVPLSRDVLWGPMAFAIMGGLIVATILTVLFVPALYVAWYRVKPDATPATAAA
ncbi:MAG: efflux RND transporter permease subunit [Burkholderiaceae bacterium]|nr:efflux RND transporter permease subunit [Burkholderiales bacterium]MCZ8106405.1 efflux RND transporter permease subunit [Burkholderiales bacterium]MCZ8340063.1 efflux RND transporter permease subunit [Burkholderiaceae bacterium]